VRSTTVFALALLTVTTACDEPGSYSGLSAGKRDELAAAAGWIARYSVLSPCDSLRPRQPTPEEVQDIVDSCRPRPEAWAYLYRCISDTVAKLEPPEPTCRQEGVEGYSEEEIGDF